MDFYTLYLDDNVMFLITVFEPSESNLYLQTVSLQDVAIGLFALLVD